MARCLIRVLMIPVCMVVMAVLFWIWHPDDDLSLWYYLNAGGGMLGIFSGVFVWFIWMSILDMRRLIRLGGQLHHPDFTDGSPCVISGPLQAQGGHLEAPFSGQQCCGYHYRVRRRRGDSSYTEYEGCALTPSVIRSPFGDIPILAAPAKELFYQLKLNTYGRKLSEKDQEVHSRAKTYLDNTDFGTTEHGPGHFRVDEKKGKETVPLEDCHFEEKVAVERDEYLLSGVYSADPHGIRPDPDTIFNPFNLISDGVAGLNKRLRNRWIGNIICLAIVVGFYFLSIRG